MAVRIAIVEDNPALRQRFVERFRFFEDVDVVFAAGTGEQCVALLSDLDPDLQPEVVLMDIELPGMSGIDTTRHVKAAHPDVEVMMCTVFEDEEKVFESLRAGASGYLLKDAAAGDVVGAILELVAGGAPMSPAIGRKVLAFVRSDGAASRGQGGDNADQLLSERELQILELIVQDELETEIAERLFISPHTVRTHIKNIYKKLHVHSRASAVRVAFEKRLLS